MPKTRASSARVVRLACHFDAPQRTLLPSPVAASSPIQKLLIANRGEIAIRLCRAASEMGITAIAIYSDDDEKSLHRFKADEAVPLKASGAAAYLDIESVVAAAKAAGADAVHPGYGFLSENAEFALRCEQEGIIFVGPTSDTIALFGDKTSARALAHKVGVSLLPGTLDPVDLDGAKQFFASLPSGASMMLKAVAGGGGRGMRAVHAAEDVEEAFTRCTSEAAGAFGDDRVFAEQLMLEPRHIELLGDGTGAVSHLYERDCSLQRNNQKVIEIAPCPSMSDGLRERLTGDAVRLCSAANYRGAATVEFLVDSTLGDDASVAFMEVNPRLQVEHTITEEVVGVDIVRAMLRIASGETLESMGLVQEEVPPPRGFAIQARVNMETMIKEGEGVAVRPAGGTISAYQEPGGPGIRVDAYGYTGYRTSPSFDSLLAKVIGSSPSGDFGVAVSRTYRALCEFQIEGVRTNIEFLKRLLAHPLFATNKLHTGVIAQQRDVLVDGIADPAERRHVRPLADPNLSARQAGAEVNSRDPLAVLDVGAGGGGGLADAESSAMMVEGPAGTVPIPSPMQGTIVSLAVAEGGQVFQGQKMLIMNSMKMEHEVAAEVSGTVVVMCVKEGDTIYEGEPLAFITEQDLAVVEVATEEIDLDYIPPALAESFARHALLEDRNRTGQKNVIRRREQGKRTARENVAQLLDEGSFVEYGGLVVAAQTRKRSDEDLLANTPADGMISGIGSINSHLFDDENKTRCMVMAYDYTVLAGTQGSWNHLKKDRMFEICLKWKLPVVFFAEGGGGRPGDTDGMGAGAGLAIPTFAHWGQLSGLVPMVGITTGYCFAGNAVILGACDVIIATKGSNIGIGGPAMIEGGGLGVFHPSEVGPMEVNVPNGVVDIAVEDEVEAVEVAQRYLSYFQGSLPEGSWECADQRLLRFTIPENRLRVYDVRELISTLVDTGSVLELRPKFGVGMVTALVRVEGRPMGVIANNCKHLSGAIDSDAADKASRMMNLCDVFDIPILFLCDCPGFMVGPESEKNAAVRHMCRMIVTAGSLTIPYVTIVTRKAYGLGAQAMAGGSLHAPIATVGWPTSEFGGMGLEGAVKLGQRKELEAIKDVDERIEYYESLVAKAYEYGRGLSNARFFEIDDVIDPADSRKWIVRMLKSVPPPPPREGKKRHVDSW